MPAESFPEQASLDTFSTVLLYSLGTVFVLLAVVAVGFMDHGLVRRKNMIDTWVQKLLCALFSGLAMLVVGYAFWNWQFNEAFGVPDPLSQALSDWWIGGTNFSQIATGLDPEIVPQADVAQSFGPFFFGFAALLAALLHSAVVERVKALPMFVLAVVAGGVVMPILAYLTWGSASPLTNSGVHDYVGAFCMYVFVGTWALVLAWRARPRLGAVTAHPRTGGPAPQDLGWSSAGVGLLMVALPFAIFGCGYYVADVGYFGISLSSSGLGLVLTNIFVAYAAGAIAGGAIAYATRKPVMVLFGPIAGYIGCAAGLDVFTPVQTFFVALGGPVVAYFGMVAMRRLRIDETKIVPLTLFTGSYGITATGFVAWGTPTGGYFGLTGEYAFQGAEITPWWQLIGLVVTIAIAGVSGLALVLLLEKTIGLRVSEESEIAGLDAHYWGPAPSDDDVAPAEAQNIAPVDAGRLSRTTD